MFCAYLESCRTVRYVECQTEPSHIRESVYRDDTDEVSRHPRTKRLKTRRESLPRLSKHTSNSLRAHIYLYMFPKISYEPSVLHARLRSYAISRFSCHHILHLFFFFFFFFKPAISLPVPVQALIFSLKVSNFAGGVHGHQAIVYFLPQVTTVDHGALPWSSLNNAICC